MIVKLYKVSDAKNVIGKSLGNPTEIEIFLKDGSLSVTKPFLILSGKGGTVNYWDFNYCWISEFNRFYFIENIDNFKADLWKLDLECDVLETFKADILTSHANFFRKVKDGDYNDAEFIKGFGSVVKKEVGNVTYDRKEKLIISTVGVGE